MKSRKNIKPRATAGKIKNFYKRWNIDNDESANYLSISPSR